LGASPLAVDEYYMAQSVRNILQHGLPMFDCGGFYTRGLLHQYVAAALQIVGVSPEVALRIISALAYFAAIPALFLIGDKLGGRLVGIVAVILFSLSIWEIEFSRFGRMYAPFQAVFAWYLWFLIQAIQGNHRAYYSSVALSVISLAIYEASVILLALNFIPLITGEIRHATARFSSVAALLAGYSFLSTDFRSLGADNALPVGYTPLPGDDSWPIPIDKPLVLLENFSTLPIVLVAVISLAMILWITTRLRAGSPDHKSQMPIAPAVIWATVAIIGSILNLFGFVFVVGLSFWLWNWIKFDQPLPRGDRVLIIWILSWLVLWSSYIWMQPESIGESQFSAIEFIRTLFLYPDLYSEIAYRWFMSMPIASAILSGTIIAGVILAKTGRWKGKDASVYLFIVGLLIALTLLVSILPQPHKSIRYTFFLYPAVLLAVSSVLIVFAQKYSRSTRIQALVIVGLISGYCVLSEDINFSYVKNIATDHVIFRTNLTKWQEDIVYRRWDYESPAVYVNQAISDGEEVLTTSQSVPFYLDRLDYFYRRESGTDFLPVTACGGTRDLWSNASLVFKQDRLESIVEERVGALWLVLRSSDRDEASPEERKIAIQHSDKIQHVSRDGRLTVFYLPNNEFGANEGQRIQ
jgi:hypothetical protein